MVISELTAEPTAMSLPVPFSVDQAQVGSTAELTQRVAAMQRALELGLSSVVVGGAEALLAERDLAPTLKDEVAKLWVIALLDEDRAAEAQKVIDQWGGQGVAWRLRAGLVALRAKNVEAAKSALGAVRVDELLREEQSWWYFGQGMLADAARDFERAANFFQQAIDGAGSANQRARFILAREKVRLLQGEANEAMVKSLRQTMERNAGSSISHRAASRLAVALHLLGRKTEAVALLQEQLQALNAASRPIADEWELLIGLMAGADDGVGRSALLNLVARGVDRDKQRVALRLLMALAPESAGGVAFRARLDELIAAPDPGKVLEDLLMSRAELALRAKAYASAEADADRLLKQFPGSDHKVSALRVQASAAWAEARYRSAASFAASARAELSAGNALRQKLGVLMAEAYFRARDFRTAADAYASVLQESHPGDGLAGLLLFQQIQSEIELGFESGKMDTARAAMDRASSDGRFDPERRWQAEWNLARALQAAGQAEDAYTRVAQLSAKDSALLPQELRARLLWLQAQLALAVGKPAEAGELALTLGRSLGGLPPTLRDVLAANALLLQAESDFALKDEDRARQAIEELRKTFLNTEAAIYSYVIESDAKASRGDFAGAQAIMQNLADTFPTAAYAPYALFQAGVYAERRAGEQYLREAYTILENLVEKHPASDLVFTARLRQGNLLRVLNDYSAAQRIYEDLVNKFSRSAEVHAAELALADCHAAQASTNATHQGSAMVIYERLLALPTAPADVRIEAGFKCGLSYEQYGNIERSQDMWWRVLNTFLLAPENKPVLGSRGRYWLARTVIYLAEQLDRQGKPEQARNARALIQTHGLPGVAWVQELLSRPSVSLPSIKPAKPSAQ